MKAFPIPEHTKRDYEFPPKHEGMDLKDYFAAKALQGLIAGCYAGNNVGFTVEGNVFAAYEYADAMMKARSK